MFHRPWPGGSEVEYEKYSSSVSSRRKYDAVLRRVDREQVGAEEHPVGVPLDEPRRGPGLAAQLGARVPRCRSAGSGTG